MDLTSGAPFWPIRDGLLATFPALTADRKTDVAVIGGGIAGALVAHRFTSAGVQCVLVDGREIGHGSTSASTALLQYELDTHLIDLIEMVGRRRAERAYCLAHEAVGEVERLACEGRDHCLFRRRKSVYLASRRGDADALRREYEARKALGLRVEFLGRRDIQSTFSFSRQAAILSMTAGEVDPYRLTHKLLAAAQRRGLEVYDRTYIQNVSPVGRGVALTTDAGHRIRARRVVFATGYETPEYLDQKIVTLKSTFALATAKVDSFDGWGQQRCLIWESARPYFYARTTDEGRVILGGEDRRGATAHAQEGQLRRRAKSLLGKFRRLFPQIPVVADWRWAGTFGETRDGLPYIGTNRQFPRAYFALGYGGNGITFSLIAARLLVDLFLERRNPDIRIFGFDR